MATFKVITLPAKDITETSAHIGMTTDDGGPCSCQFYYKKGIDGPIQGTARGTRYMPFWALIYNLVPHAEYYFQGMGRRTGTGWIYGEWLTFTTGVKTMHFKAYGIDPKGKIIYGEDMYFEY